MLYVAMTRAKNALTLVHPLRFFIRQQHRHGDRYVMTPRSRFLADSVLGKLELRGVGAPDGGADSGAATGTSAPTSNPPRVDVAARLRSLWA